VQRNPCGQFWLRHGFSSTTSQRPSPQSAGRCDDDEDKGSDDEELLSIDEEDSELDCSLELEGSLLDDASIEITRSSDDELDDEEDDGISGFKNLMYW